MVGEIISHYRITEKLGEGGMGVVYKAEDTQLKRFVALKFLPANLTQEEDANERFIREARAASALDHPNICTIHAIEQTDKAETFICMAYYDGETLNDKIRRRPLPIEEVIDIANQIANGLARAHEAGIIHRDIKPGNIIVTNRGEVKILDFGLAKLVGQTFTKSGSTLGTVAYMSPEQVHGGTVDERTDIWALGVVLYELLTGEFPFKGEYEPAIQYAILHLEPEPITGLRTGVPMELDRVVSKALAKNPNERYQHVDEMLVDLKSVGKRLEPRTPKQALARAKPHARRRKFLAAFVFFVLLVSGAATYFQLLREKENDDGIAPGQKTETSSSSQWQNSIAVLPFENISPDPGQEYFCDGMTEQIITNLSQLQKLRVIARTSVMRLKNTEKSVPEIAEELGVAHILEGSIRKVGNRIRVTAQLIQADEGHHLWAKDYDRELGDIFAVQDDVSEAIARALFKKLTIKEAEEIKTKGTDNVEAYEYNLKGGHFHTKFFGARRTEDFRKSERVFKKAIELDPNYGLAYAGLADLYNTYFYTLQPENEEEKKKYLDLQQNLLEIALRLDPNSARVIMVKGAVHHAKGETDKTYESYKRALEIDPNESDYYRGMGNLLERRGLLHQKIKYFTKALKLNPLNPTYYHSRGVTHLRLGNVDQSIIDYQNALELEPDSRGIRNGLAKCLMIAKKYSEAEEHLIKCEKLIPGHPDTKKTRSLFGAALGKKDEALESLKDNGLNTKYNKMAVYCLLGLKDEAIKLIDNEPWTDYLAMLHHPYFEILRDTDEFKAALPKAKKIYEENLKKYEEVFL